MPKPIDRFTLGEILAASEVATLYAAMEALPAGVSRPVTLKVYLPPGPEDREAEARFTAELRNLATIGDAPHVSSLYSSGVTDNIPWISLSGATGSVINALSDAPSDPKFITQLLQDVLAGLKAIHSAGLLHNDVKPGSLLQTASQGIILTELSLAAAPTAEITQQADMVRYAAPEVFSREFGKLSASTDLYALGHIVYELALGSRNWRAQFPQVFDAGTRARDPINPAKWMAWHCSTPTRPAAPHEVNKAFPTNLGEVISKLMAKEPAQRYGSAADALSALQAGPVTAEPPPIPTAATPGGSATAQGVPPMPPHRTRTFVPRPATAVPPASATSGSTAPPPPLADAAAVPGGQLYYVRLRNKQSGPFDFATLQRHAKAGLLSRLHQVSTDSMNWRPATTVDGLFS